MFYSLVSSSGWYVGALCDGCRRTEGLLSPTLIAKGYDLPTPKQKAALIGWNQVNDDEEKKAWHAVRVYGCQLYVPGSIQSGLTMSKKVGSSEGAASCL